MALGPYIVNRASALLQNLSNITQEDNDTMPYVGHRAVLPIQNTNEWKHNVNGVVGVYSNWSLQSSVHALDEVGEGDLPNFPQYAQGRHLSQVFNGEFTYKPMELAKFSHGGQDAPYLRHEHWKFHGVDSASVFPRGDMIGPAAPARLALGPIAAGGRDYSEDNEELTFTLVVGTTTTTHTLDGNYVSRPAFVAALNDEIAGATFTEESGRLYLTSDAVGNDAKLEITAADDPIGNSGVRVAGPAEGSDATYSFGFGYSLEEKRQRNFTFSRHSNWFFYGVPSADATFTGREAMSWDDPELPSYARRHAPFEFKGVGDDHLEDAGEALATKQTRAEDSNEYAHQQVKVWRGVASSKAL